MTRFSFELGRWQDSPGGAIAVVCALVVLSLLILSIYRRDVRRQSTLVRRVLLSLRFSLLLAVGLMLLEPRLSVEKESERVSCVLLAVDDSLSMSLPLRDVPPSTESQAVESRWRGFLSQAKRDQLATAIGRTHEVGLYRAGEKAQKLALLPRGGVDQDPLPSLLEPISPSSPETRLGDSLVSMLKENLDAPLAGLVVVTDGRQTGGGPMDGAIRLAKESRTPIFPVGVGSTTPPFNLRVAEIRVPARVFRGDRVNGTALVQAKGKHEGSVAIEIFLRQAGSDGAATMLEVQDIPMPPDDTPVSISFPFIPEQLGSYEIVCRAAVQQGEIRSDDNQTKASIDVVDQKTKVLLWAGGPTREYRFLRNLLYRDSSMELAVHLQSARATSAQESKESLATFPKTRDELFKYDVLIAIDPDWEAIGRESSGLVEEWISRQAGGAILIAGPVNTPKLAHQVANAPGSPAETIYPVILREVFTSDFEAGRFRDPWKLSFTSEGDRANYLRLDDDEGKSHDRWNQFAGFYWCYPATSLKPSATLLASYSDPRASVGTSPPALMAVQFLGSGRVFYLGSGELWRLRATGESAYDRFWVRLVREMSQSRLMRGSSRAMLLVDADRVPAGTSLPIRAQILGPDYRPKTQGVVSVSIVGPDQKSVSIDLVPSPARPGYFEGSMPLSVPGEYRLQMLVPDSNDLVERSVVAEIPASEFAEPTLDEAGLQHLAHQTGGQYLPLTNLSQLPNLLTDRSERVLLTASPILLWDNGWVMVGIVALAGLEWLIRKSVHLA